MSKTRYGHLVSSTSWFCPLRVMRYKLLAGFKSINGQVEILDSDSLCYLVKNYSKGAVGVRTISKSLLNEYVNYFEKYPDNNADQARKDLGGHTSVDKFEYGYSSTLTTMAKMILGEQLSSADKLLSYEDAKSKSIDQPLQLIYYGAPGTGKSFTIDQVTNENNSVRTTFHPDSDYASFVGAYKPTMAPMPINAFVGTTVHHAKNAENEKAYEKKIVYKYVPQAFLKAYVEAWKRYAAGEDNPYYLVIEEINRGNCAQVFGDIFQLLDRSDDGWSTYPIKADTDIAEHLKEHPIPGYAATMNKRFGLDKSGCEKYPNRDWYGFMALPPNMSILATMNTSDQSLFPIDSAFKRRWDWKYIKIKKGKSEDGMELGWKIQIENANGEPVQINEKNTELSWWDFINKVNEIIASMTSSADKQLGYFFCKPSKKADETDEKPTIITADTLVGKVIFYLWNDVFKDYGFEDASLFTYEKEVNGKKMEKDLAFADFYDEEGEKVDTERLIDFLQRVMKWQNNKSEND